MVKKVDYFCGALIAYLLSSKTSKSTPVLCGESKNSKFLSFCTDNGEYNLYIKYSRTFNEDKKGDKKCSFQFTDDELDKIKQYASEKNNLYITLICTNENLNTTEIAFIPVHKALKILGFDNVNTKRQIYVKHLKGKHYLNVWGTMLDEINALKVKRDFNWIFEKRSQKIVA